MARATGSRSQRQPSQSQNARNAMQPSQSQRGTRRGHEEEEEEEEEDGEDGEQNGVDEGEGDGDGRGDDIDRKASDLVRLALFHEQRRIPLRRDEISKKVMGSKSRKFGEVFTRAQEILRKTFGMELVELQTRVEEKDDEQKKDLEKLGIKKKTASTNTKTFILRSVLHPSLIEIAASPDDDILRVEQADHTEDDDGDEGSSRCTGALLAWQNSDQLGSVGVLYVILALILVNGKTISDSELRSLLKRMRLPGAANVPQNNQSPLQMFTFDAFLTICIRQGYLDRQRVGEVKGAGKKRGRAAVGTQAGGDDNANAWEWRWGSRAMSEVGEVDIARFVTDFMVERERAETGGEDEEDEDEDERQEAEKRREQVMKGVERAASGSLAGITGS